MVPGGLPQAGGLPSMTNPMRGVPRAPRAPFKRF
jgi:hypothetical protein